MPSSNIPDRIQACHTDSQPAGPTVLDTTAKSAEKKQQQQNHYTPSYDATELADKLQSKRNTLNIPVQMCAIVR